MATPEAKSDPIRGGALRYRLGAGMICACGVTFKPLRKNQAFHSQECQRDHTRNAARADRRASTLQFIGVDGEGVNLNDGSHRYVMLSVGDDTLFSATGLEHNRIFDFLYAAFERNPYHVFEGFYLGYDFSQWLKSLPEDLARSLYDPKLRTLRVGKTRIIKPVEVDGWQIDIIATKRFKLRPVGKKRWMYVCDGGSYYQSSFLTAINPAYWPKPIVSGEEFAELVSGKDSRGDILSETDLTWDGPIMTAMREYNTLENRALSRVMHELAAGYESVGIKPGRDAWYGPGSAAQAWIRSLDVPTPLLREDVCKVVTSEQWQSAQNSYYGGHFETFMHGIIPGETYEYDIQSAYPDTIRRLPCICQGLSEDEAPTFAHISAIGSDPALGPLPHRNDKGAITSPHLIKGWYPWEEIRAAQRAGLIDRLNYHQFLGIRPCEHPPPFAILADLFALRLSVGKNSAQGRAIKLVLNSVYGKLSQTVGAAKYSNPVYAALITGGCRTAILNAIATHPNKASELVMIATDGVFFRTPHPGLDLTPSILGGWERNIHSNLTIMKPGMYWNDATRDAIANDEVVKIKSRGVSGSVLAGNIGELDDAFAAMTCEADLPTIRQVVPFSFTSAKLALQQGKWERAGLIAYDKPRIESAQIGPKRRNLYRDGDVWRSEPGLPENPESYPYQKDFGGWV